MKAEGIWDCEVLSARYGANDKGVVTVQITAQIASGPDKGQRATYEEEANARSAKYLRYSCEAVGWKGDTLKTLEADCAAWIKETGGKSTVEIKHLEIRNGQRAGQTWDKVNGIGRGAARPLRQASAADLKDADDALRSVGGGSPPHDDAPHAGETDDIPFLHHGEPSPIARSVR